MNRHFATKTKYYQYQFVIFIHYSYDVSKPGVILN